MCYLCAIYVLSMCCLCAIYMLSIQVLQNICRISIQYFPNLSQKKIPIAPFLRRSVDINLISTVRRLNSKASWLVMASLAETQPTETQEQVNATESSCVKCGLATTLNDGAVQRGHGLQCRSCNNVYQILYRHLGGLPPSFQGMSTEEQGNFFKSTGKNVATTPKNGRWSLVKKNLVTSMVSFKRQQTTTSLTKDFFPLSVWQVKGFDTKEIEAKGERRDDDVSWTIVISSLKIAPTCK